ncbi:MAG: alpha/beta hydrolase [Ignavibacteria bacterium]
MVRKSNIRFTNPFAIEIDTDLFCISGKQKSFPLVIFSHGFKGFKDWGGFPYMIEKLSGSGIAALSFNFTFNGVESSRPTEFSRLDLFAQNTFTKELGDLEAFINYFYLNSEEHRIDRNRIALIGHSRGGGISILKAREDNRVKCLITLASVSDFDRYTAEHKRKWKEKGYFEVLNTRTNQMMRLNSSLLEDIENNKERLDITNAVKNLDKPYLIIHGKEDLSVRFSEAEVLYKYSDKSLTEFFPVENTGHTFGVVHPFQGTTKAFEIVINKIVEFLKKNI